MSLSKILDDGQLSREGSLRWLKKTVLPPFIIYARQLLWPEPWSPSPRCLYGCEVIAAVTLSAQTDTPGVTSRILYLLADDNDGWHPVPPNDETGHGGELVLVSSFKPCGPATIYHPTLTERELANWRARRSGVQEYWDRFNKMNKPDSWDRLTGIVLPEPKPRGWFDRLLGR